MVGEGDFVDDLDAGYVVEEGEDGGEGDGEKGGGGVEASLGRRERWLREEGEVVEGGGDVDGCGGWEGGGCGEGRLLHS